MQVYFLPAIYKFAPTLMIGSFLAKAIGQITTCYLMIGSKEYLFIGHLTQFSILFTLKLGHENHFAKFFSSLQQSVIYNYLKLI